MPWSMFSSVAGIYPGDARSTPSPVITARTVSRHCQMSLGVRITPISSHWSQSTNHHQRDISAETSVSLIRDKLMEGKRTTQERSRGRKHRNVRE